MVGTCLRRLAFDSVMAVELNVERLVFEQIADLAVEYRTGARSLRGIFEELITPILFVVPDQPDIERVVVSSLFTDPVYVRKEPS